MTSSKSGSIKRPKLESMKILKKRIGEYLIASLMREEAFLIRDSNGKFPFQAIVYLDGSTAYNSKLEGEISYECFEEVKNISPEEKKGFQNFYKLKEDYIMKYHNFIIKNT